MTASVDLPSTEDTLAYGRSLGARLVPRALVYLHGELGAGKTTLVRGLLEELGHPGEVASPTYTLMNHYELPDQTVVHLDLYRLEKPEELEYLGLRETLEQSARSMPGEAAVICLIEWPEKWVNQLLAPDFSISLDYADTGRRVTLQEA